MTCKLKAVLFDFDYTLGDSTAAILDCTRYAMAKLGLPAPADDEIRRAIGLSTPDMYYRFTGAAEADREAEQERAYAFRRHYHERADEIMVDLAYVYPPVPEVANALVKQGLKLGVVTSKHRFRIDSIFARDGLAHLFTVVVGSEDVARPKPAPDALLLALKLLPAERDEVLYVGDSEVDAMAARDAGVRFAAVLTGTTPAEVFGPYCPVAIVDDVASVPSLVAGV